jgi:hypothetical protein
MRVLRALLMHLLLSSNISKVTGFWSPFKHTNERPIKISKTNEITKVKEITWDDGEVVWENMQEYYDENQTYSVVKKRPFKPTVSLYKNTPLYEPPTLLTSCLECRRSLRWRRPRAVSSSRWD